MKIKFRNGWLIAMIVFAGLLSGCSIKVDNNSDSSHIYSREFTETVCSSTNFGSGKTDDIYVVLDYLYKSKELNDKYGDSFEISDIGGTQDGKTRLGLYNGKAKYFVDINKDEWKVELTKKYSGKWKVTSCKISGN